MNDIFKEAPDTTTTTPLTPIPGDELMTPPAPRRPAANTPTYKLRQYLRDLDLASKYPRLHPKWRRKMPGESNPRNTPNVWGTYHAAPRGKPKREEAS